MDSTTTPDGHPRIARMPAFDGDPGSIPVKFEATVRVADRRIFQTGHTRYALKDLDEDGNPTIDCGIGIPNANAYADDAGIQHAGHGEHVVEAISYPTYERIKVLEAQVAGDGGVVLASDHTVTVQPPSAEWLAAQEAATAEADALKAMVAAHPDPLVRALAQRAGIV